MLNVEKNQKDKDNIVKELKEIEKLNKEYCDIINSTSYRYISEILKTWSYLKKGKVKLVFSQMIDFIKGMLIRINYTDGTETFDETPVNYFANERIAIYTVVFGEYDLIKEPIIVPDNCDFYIITDNNISDNSVWKKMNIDKWNRLLKDKSAVEKNRFFKMNPHLLFPQYRYSIYIDGSIKIISDLTPLIYRVKNLGMAFFCHPGRKCVFDELKVLSITKKISRCDVKRYIHFFREAHMPRNFGMVECGLIVREHNNIECLNIMEKWWELFCKFKKRDQLILPYILWENGNIIDDVATLGLNIRKYYGIRVEEHK